jgi:hypothetical protein
VEGSGTSSCVITTPQLRGSRQLFVLLTFCKGLNLRECKASAVLLSYTPALSSFPLTFVRVSRILLGGSCCWDFMELQADGAGLVNRRLSPNWFPQHWFPFAPVIKNLTLVSDVWLLTNFFLPPGEVGV